MSLEEALKANTAALEANTAALLKAGAPAKAKEEKAPSKAKEEKAAVKSKHSREEMVAAVVKVKDDFGQPEAKKLIKEVGGTELIKEVPDDKIDALFDAAVAKHEELSNAGSGSDDI